MAKIALTPALKEEYARLFDGCVVDPQAAPTIDRTAQQIASNRRRYAQVADRVGIPWYTVGIIHCMEGGLRFDRHLHNGDPLTARTVQVPAGRPLSGSPPFTWEESAEDALRLERMDQWTDWSIPGTLYKLEAYNGFGYRTRHPEVLTPYLWSFSNHYTAGKYVADGTWSATAKSKQCGAAVLLRRLAEMGELQFDAQGVPLTAASGQPKPATDLAPLVRYSTTVKSEAAEQLQRALNKFPGVFVRVDGIPGQRTSDACKRVLGHYLTGDPRLDTAKLRRASAQG